jgi:ankyrin repeat protein
MVTVSEIQSGKRRQLTSRGEAERETAAAVVLLSSRGVCETMPALMPNVSIDDEDVDAGRAPPPLHEAAENGDVETVLRLVDRAGADVNEMWGNGIGAVSQPLHVACSYGRAEAAQALIERGADLNAADSFAHTPLHVSAYEGQAATTRVLLRARAQVDLATSNEQLTPLLWACVNGHEDCVRLLLDAKANPNARKDNGRTPLHVAAIFGAATCVQPLLDAKADLSIKDNMGKTALQRAQEEGNTEVANALRNLILSQRMAAHEEAKVAQARAELPVIPSKKRRGKASRKHYD